MVEPLELTLETIRALRQQIFRPPHEVPTATPEPSATRKATHKGVPLHHRVKQFDEYVLVRDGQKLIQIEEAMRQESPESYTYRELQTEAAKILERHFEN